MHFAYLKQKYTGTMPGASLYDLATREAEAGIPLNKYNSCLDYRVSSSVPSLGNLSEDFSQIKRTGASISAAEPCLLPTSSRRGLLLDLESILYF